MLRKQPRLISAAAACWPAPALSDLEQAARSNACGSATVGQAAVGTV